LLSEDILVEEVFNTSRVGKPEFGATLNTLVFPALFLKPQPPRVVVLAVYIARVHEGDLNVARDLREIGVRDVDLFGPYNLIEA
jgi:hypothetical protein